MIDPSFIPVARIGDIQPDGVKAIGLNGISILICHHDGNYYALENRCSHMEEPLVCGRMRYGWIACPAHGARFDLETGEALTPPASAPIRTFALRVVDDRIEIAV